MKFKLLTIGLVISGFILSQGLTAFAAPKKAEIPSSYVYQAINKYKQKNYTGCIQDMDYIIKNRPSDIAYYYKAISYAQLGMPDEARNAYEKASQLTTNRTLKDYATQAMNCIDDFSLCDESLDEGDITTFIKSDKFIHDDVKKDFKNKALERAKQKINSGTEVTEDELKYINQNNVKQPTDKEIADAVRTFAKLGINPMGNMMNMANAMTYQDPEMMQLNAPLGSQNNNNRNNNDDLMNLIPVITSLQNSKNNGMSKELMQTYMMNRMIPSFDLTGKNN